MSHASLRETIHNKHFIPAMIKGYKRIFNLIEEKNADILNLVKDKKERCNVVVFSIDEHELVELKKREDLYNLEEVKAFHFLTGQEIGKCLVVIDYFLDLDRKGFSPDKKYFQLCREAAYHVSKEFGKVWDETTYVSTGEKVVEWLKSNPEYEKIESIK